MSLNQNNSSKGDILVVDDTPANLRLLSRLLIHQGYKVRLATSGTLVFNAIQANKPDLVLLDIMMPEMDGYEVCQRLKANEKTRNIPIIFLSALDKVLDKVKAFSVGGVDYITKPFQAEEVIARIETHLTLRHLQKQLQEKNDQLQNEIAERKQIEQALQRINTRYRNLAANIPTMIYQYVLYPDNSHKMLYVSPACRKIFELEPEAMVEDFALIDNTIHPGDKKSFYKSIVIAAKQLIPWHYVWRIIVSGQIKWVQGDSTPEKQADGSILSDGQLMDITKLKEAEEALHHKEMVRLTIEHEKKLSQFLDAVSVGVFVLDANGNPYYANQQAQHILGKGIVPLANVEILSEVYQAYLAETSQLYPSERQPVVQALMGKETKVDDMEIHRNDKITPIEIWGNPIFDEQGNVAYAIATFQDITERKHAEAERIRFTQEVAGLNKAYERFVPREFLNLLDKQSVIDINLGDQVEKEMTILFSDIRNFTRLSEKMTPQDNFEFINAYLGQMEPLIYEYHGVIDKYIGDGIMALFPTCADDAVRGSVAMLKGLIKYNQLLEKTSFSLLHIGIGLNTGPLMLGIIGGQERMEGTVISDVVNLASRVEGLTKIYQTPLLITDHTYLKLADPLAYQIRIIDAVQVKGKSEVVTIYEVYDADHSKSVVLKNETREDFELGFVLYHSEEIIDAKPFFESVLAVNKDDKAAQVYLKRCEYFQKYGVSEERI
ncbi:response regulator [Candidatus Parabeggiatoa sp. HSG14]|uniref:response regulator n=1 Tax=Candidatus Parabeggiatoa sp. HSG14 TaxID=3055593 RepID=UPI0025A7ACDD|nr:response regulator [Thiotrichales bacterium HSG14]